MNDLISIIVPVYNSEEYLADCLESIINQSYYNLEIILVNDGSSDNSLKIMKKYQKKDSRVKIISIPNNGVYKARLVGLQKAKGKYVSFVDSDDLIKKNYVYTLYYNLIEYKADVARCELIEFESAKMVNLDDISLDNYRKNNDIYGFYEKPINCDIIFKKMSESIFFNSLCRQLISREVLLKSYISNSCSLSYAEDLFANFNVLMNVENMIIIDDILYLYRNHNSGVTKIKKVDSYYKNMVDICFVFNYICDEMNKINNSKYNHMIYGKLTNDIARLLIKCLIVDKRYVIYYSLVNNLYINDSFNTYINNVDFKTINNINHRLYKYIIILISKKHFIISYIILLILSVLKRK